LNKFISIDVQRYVRIIDTHGALVNGLWPEEEEILSMADIVKTDAVGA